ncbi:MAG: arylesterase [Chthoniobacterales bacterium]
MGKLTLRAFAIALALAIFVRAETTSKTIVFLGDSLTAGYGVKPNESFPALIGEKIRAAKLPYEVENAGLSGDTTAGGLRRIDWFLQRKVDVLVIELGGNDGLRGLPVAALKSNIQAIIDKVRAKNPEVKIVIAGMKIPPNLGAEYAHDFAATFPEIAEKNNAALIPFLLEGVGGMREFNQADSIHPTAEGHRTIAETVWKNLEPLLK